MDAIADKRDRLPRVSVELQHTFPGCYSVMHDIKSAQRHGEHLLDQAEHAAVAFASDEADRRSSLARIEQAWDDLLFTEFHDILTGTSIPSAWGSVRAMQGRARIAAEEVLFEVTRRWSYRVLPRVNEHQIVVINTHDTPFRGFVEAEPYLDFDDWRGRWLCDERGKSVRFQEIQPESNQLIPRILFPAEIAATSARQFQVRTDPPPRNRPARNAITASRRQLSNGLLAISLGAGGISQIALRGVNLLGRGGIGLHLRHDSTDTWTFHTDRWAEAVEARLGDGAWQVEESGPLRGRVRMDARLRNSRVDLDRQPLPRVSRASRSISSSISTSASRFCRCRFALPTSPRAGSTASPAATSPRSSGPTEWPFLGWSRLRVGETDIGLVTNDAYSHSVNGALWQPTLLRSPKMAWGGGRPVTYSGHDHHTDQGVHGFRFELRFARTLRESDLALAVRGQAQPLVVFDRYEGMDRPAWGPVPPRGLWGPAMLRNVAEGLVSDPGQEAPGGLFKRPGTDYSG